MRLRRGTLMQTLPPIDPSLVQEKHRFAVSANAKCFPFDII